MSDLGLSTTVIVPTFRRNELMQRAVRSVLDESLERLEVLVIDDSPEHAAEQAVAELDDDRVVYLTMAEPTGGVPALVRNHGIDRASGDVLYFLDDDDTIVPGGLRAMVDAFSADLNVGMAFGQVLCEGPDAFVAAEYTAWFDWAAKTAGRLRRSSLLTAATILFRGTLIINSCCAVRRHVAKSINGYDPAIDVFEDVEFFLRAMRASGHVHVPQPVLNYQTGLPSIIHDLEGDSAPIRDSYTVLHQKYRAAHGGLEYRFLQLLGKLLPVGSPYRAQEAVRVQYGHSATSD